MLPADGSCIASNLLNEAASSFLWAGNCTVTFDLRFFYRMIHFQLFGFPVAVHWMFWVITALLGGAEPAILSAPTFGETVPKARFSA